MITVYGKPSPQTGDIIEYNGKKYYTKEWVVGQPCCFDICALRNQCKKFSKEFRCENPYYFLTLKQVITEEKRKIKEEKRKIKDSEKLIRKIQNEYYTQ